MKRKRSSESYLALVIAAVLVLTIAAIFFSRYLEDRTQRNVEVSSFYGLENTSVTSTQGTAQRQSTTTGNQPVNTALSSSANDILQLISQSINNPDHVEIIFEQFTNQQVDDISLDEYRNYISLLTDIVGTKIESYSTMSYSDRESIRYDMLEHSDNYETFLNNASFHWLEYRQDEELARIPILISQDSNSFSYLSSEWVRGSMRVRNYADLYFKAIFEDNFESFINFTYSTLVDDAVRLEKANALLTIYDDHVNVNAANNTMISSIRMDAVTYRIPMNSRPFDRNADLGSRAVASPTPTATNESEESAENNAEDITPASEVETTTSSTNASENLGYHEVTVYQDVDSFIVEDVVANDAWKYDAVIYREETPIFSLGESVSLAQIQNELGEASSQEIISLILADSVVQDYYHLSFPSIDLYIEIDSQVEEFTDNTEARILGFDLLDDTYTLAGEYFVGQSIRSLLSHYLYIDTLQYRYTNDSNEQSVIMEVNGQSQVNMIRAQDQTLASNLSLYSSTVSDSEDLFENITTTTTTEPTTSETNESDESTETISPTTLETE